MSHKINLRVDEINDSHVKTTLFIDGANSGSLVFDIGGYQIFSTILLMGIKATNGHAIDVSDYSVFERYAKTGELYKRIPE